MSSPGSSLPSPRFAAGRDGLLLALGPDQWLEFLLHLCLGPSPLCIPSLSVLTPRRLMEVKKHRFQKCCSRSQLTNGSNSGQYLQNVLILKGKEVKGAPRSGGLCPVPDLETAVTESACPAEPGCRYRTRPPEPGPPLSRALHVTAPCPDEEEEGGRMVQVAQTLSGRRALKTEGRVRSSGAAADWTCHECVCCP